MKRLKPLALALMAIFSLTIAAASVAQAAEFRSLPETAKFTFKSKAGEKTVLRTLSGKEVKCEKVTGSGEFKENGQLGPVVFLFVGCLGPLSVKCTGLTDETPGNITVNATFHIRHLLVAGAAKEVSIDVLVGTVHFSCLGVLFVVTGNVCSDDVTLLGGGSIVNQLALDFLVNFLESAVNSGDPAVTSVDKSNGLEMETCELLTKEGSATAETSSQRGEGTLECLSVTCLIDLSGTF